MPDVKWKRGILWTLVHLGLKGGVSADDYDSAYRDPVKWDLLDLFTIKKLPYQTGIKASRENYCGEVRKRPYKDQTLPNEQIYTSAQRIMRGLIWLQTLFMRVYRLVVKENRVLFREFYYMRNFKHFLLKLLFKYYPEFFQQTFFRLSISSSDVRVQKPSHLFYDH